MNSVLMIADRLAIIEEEDEPSSTDAEEKGMAASSNINAGSVEQEASPSGSIEPNSLPRPWIDVDTGLPELRLRSMPEEQGHSTSPAPNPKPPSLLSPLA